MADPYRRSDRERADGTGRDPLTCRLGIHLGTVLWRRRDDVLDIVVGQIFCRCGRRLAVRVDRLSIGIGVS